MQLILQTGVHHTEHERLIKSVLRNREMLTQRGVAVPGPGSYRGLVRETLNAMHRTPASADAREVLMDAMLDDDTAERLILSDPNFFRSQATAFQEGYLYPAAPRRMARMRELFAQDELEVFVALRNPATLLPALYRDADDKSDAGFWGGMSPENVRWSETIADIRAAVPDVPLTIWCAEDMPLIWAEILREICGLDGHVHVEGAFDLLFSIMSEEGQKRFTAYVGDRPELSEIQLRRVIVAFLDKFALPEEIEEELDMPGWTDDLVAELTAIYDEDVLAIGRMPGVSLITP